VNKGEGGKIILEKMKKCAASIQIRTIQTDELNIEVIETSKNYIPKKERFQEKDIYIWDTETMDNKTDILRTLKNKNPEFRTNAKVKALGIAKLSDIYTELL
jgi:hypothetical protein